MLPAIALALALGAEPAPARPDASPPPAPVEKTEPVYGPPAPRKAKTKLKSTAAADADKQCADTRQTVEDKTTIIVCGQSSEQYRLDPDILQAEEARKAARRGAPPPQPMPGAMPDTGICERSGGCRALEAVNWVGVAMVAAQMIDKAVKGENVAKTFVTTPQTSEYDYYKQAKAYRAAKEEEEDAEAAAKRARDARAAKEKESAPAPATEATPPATAAPDQ